MPKLEQLGARFKNGHREGNIGIETKKHGGRLKCLFAYEISGVFWILEALR
jgi:hypothetical protein